DYYCVIWYNNGCLF
nr:immunoglobulin light chain junction region [Macaca mulatta]